MSDNAVEVPQAIRTECWQCNERVVANFCKDGYYCDLCDTHLVEE